MDRDLEAEFVEFAEARLPRFQRLAHQLCGDVDHADDIVQLALTRMYTHWSKVRSADNVDAYARSVVVRTFLAQQRLAWARVVLLDRLPDRPAEDDGSIDDRLLVQAALQRISPKLRAVLILRFVHDLSVAETAATLGCAEGTVKRRTFDAVNALRRVLGHATFPAVAADVRTQP
jgi:RNA polymerase sigma-70 factor (sigma-E family)